MQCYGMPIPRNVRELLEEPPHIRIEQKDYAIQAFIRDFGRKYGISENEIDRACDLASGLSDIVILLERPSDGHNYSDSFEDFVKNCEALNQLDQIIRFASKGKRSIYDVTVLDAYTFQPNNKPERARLFQAAWFEELWRILKVKQPKIIVSCWGVGNPCSNKTVVKLRSNGVGRWPVRDSLRLDGGPAVFVMRSLHPSAAGYHGERRPNCLLLLICHFVFAFAFLAGKPRLPDWLQPLCDRAESEKWLKGEYSKEGVQFETIRALEEMMGSDPMFADGLNSLPARVLTDDERVLYAVRRFLGSKAGRKADLTRLATVCHMWKHSPGHMAKDAIISSLISIATQQRLDENERPTKPVKKTQYVGFADDEDAVDSIADDVCNLQIESQTSEVDRGVDNLRDINTKTLAKVTEAKQLLQSAKALDSHIDNCFVLGLGISSTLSEDDPYLGDSAEQLLSTFTQQMDTTEETFRRAQHVCHEIRGRIGSAKETNIIFLAGGSTATYLTMEANVLLHTFIMLTGLVARLAGISGLSVRNSTSNQEKTFMERLSHCDQQICFFRKVLTSLKSLQREAKEEAA